MKSLGRLVVIALLNLGVAHSSTDTPRAHCFDNEDVERVLSHSHATPQLVYVWSARSPLSSEQLQVASRIAAINGMDFTAVHDNSNTQQGYDYQPPKRMSDPAKPNLILTTPPYFPVSHSSHMLCAPALLNRDAFRHFPSAFVISRGKIHPHPIVGAMPDAAWQQSIAERLASL